MPLSLAEHLVTETNPLRKGVFLGLTRASVIADMISWSSVNSLSTSGVRYDGVIRPEWNALNAPFVEKTIRGKNLSYGVYRMGAHIDIENPLERDQGVKERPSTRQTKQTILGAAYVMNDTFVNGDQAGNPNQFEGIEKILGNLGSSQNIGSSEIDVRLSQNPNDATIYSLFERLDEAIDAINGGEPDFALINRQTGLVIRSLMRRIKLPGDHYDWVKGMPFSDIRKTYRTAATRPMFVYNNCPFFDIGNVVDEAGNETAIIGNTYSEGGSSNATRIFFVKQGADDLEGLQYQPMTIKKIADTLESKDVQRHRMTWMVGLGAWSKDCVSAARGIRVI